MHRAYEIFPTLKADALPVEVWRDRENAGTWVMNANRTVFISNADKFNGQWLYYSSNVRDALRSLGIEIIS